MKNKKFKKTEIKVLSPDCFRIQIKGFGTSIDLSLKEFLSLKETFVDWIRCEAYTKQNFN
jgi:hypothetical protein